MTKDYYEIIQGKIYRNGIQVGSVVSGIKTNIYGDNYLEPIDFGTDHEKIKRESCCNTAPLCKPLSSFSKIRKSNSESEFGILNFKRIIRVIFIIIVILWLLAIIGLVLFWVNMDIILRLITSLFRLM